MSQLDPHPIRVAMDDESGAMQPFLYWNQSVLGGGGMALACPQCASPNLNLDTVHFATPTNDQTDPYAPVIGLTINPNFGTVIPDDQARQLHASQNRGPMFSISYWCGDGCRGRIEFRGHKGNLYASLHDEPPMTEEDLDPGR